MLVDESSTRPSSASKLHCPQLYFVPVSPAYQSNGRHAASRNRGALQHVSASIPRRSDRDSSEYCCSRQTHAGIDCVASYSLPLTRISRNFIGNLTPRRKTGFRKFPWKFDPLGRKSRPFLLNFPLGTPQNLEMPLRASENLRFQVQKSQNH